MFSNSKLLNKRSLLKTSAVFASICLSALIFTFCNNAQASAEAAVASDVTPTSSISWNVSNTNLLRATNTTKSLDFSKVSVDTANKTYTSYQIRPRVSAYGLKANCDYVVSYGKNTDAGTGTVTVRGIGNYTGSKTYKFPIAKAPLYVSWGNVDLTYNTQAQLPVATVTGILGKDKVVPTVTGEKTYPGNGYVAYLRINNSNYALNGATSTLFNIAKAPLTLQWDQLSIKCTGQPQVPSATVSGLFGDDQVDVKVEGAQVNASENPYVAVATVDSELYEIYGDNTVQFTIEKGDLDFAVPAGVKGYVESDLSTVKIPNSEYGYFTWDNPETVLTTVGTSEANQFSATFTPFETQNYNIVKNVMIPVEVLKNYYDVTFDTNVPIGCAAYLNGEDVPRLTSQLMIDSAAAEKVEHKLNLSEIPEIEAVTGHTGYVFAGWSKDGENADYGVVKAQLANTSVSEDTTYYAVWKKETGFWLGTANASEEFSTEASFVANDVNYHSSQEIEADMAVLHNSSDERYASVKAKWEGFYANADAGSGIGNNVRLYATYAGGETEQTIRQTEGKNQLNKYAEFRILEVSKDTSGHDADGSAVTFMATHTLPTTYVMNINYEISDLGEGCTNIGGWGNTELKTNMNSGEIYNKFSSSFQNAIKTVEKKCNKAGVRTKYKDRDVNKDAEIQAAQLATPELVDCKFWIPSYSEFIDNNAEDFSSYFAKYEGTQYDWFKLKCIKSNENNDCLMFKTRAGVSANGSIFGSLSDLWLRSANLASAYSFGYTGPKGSLDYCGGYDELGYSYLHRSIVPCFCF